MKFNKLSVGKNVCSEVTSSKRFVLSLIKNVIALILLLSVSVSNSSCKSKEISKSDSEDSKNPFEVTSYYSAFGNNKLTILSSEKLELVDNNTIVVCSYSKKGTTLRVEINTAGTTNVMYLEEENDGLRLKLPDNTSGVFLHNEKSYERVKEEQRIAQEAEINKHREQLEAEKTRMELIAAEKIKSLIPTRTIKKIQIGYEGIRKYKPCSPVAFSITDVSLKFEMDQELSKPFCSTQAKPETREIPFAFINRITSTPGGMSNVPGLRINWFSNNIGYYTDIAFKYAYEPPRQLSYSEKVEYSAKKESESSAQRAEFVESLRSSIKEWQKNYPLADVHRIETGDKREF